MATLSWLQNLAPSKSGSQEPSLFSEIHRMGLEVLSGHASYGAWQELVKRQQQRLKKAYRDIEQLLEELEEDHPAMRPALQAKELLSDMREFLKPLSDDVNARQPEQLQTLLSAIAQRAGRLEAVGLEMEDKVDYLGCPVCGHWNSPSLSHCDQCRESLEDEDSLEVEEEVESLPPDYERLWELVEAVASDPKQQPAFLAQIRYLDGNLQKFEPLADSAAVLKALKEARRGLSMLAAYKPGQPARNLEKGWQTLMDGMASFEELTQD